MKIIVTGNYAEYRNYLRETGLCERDAIYASSQERLLGMRLRPGDIVRTGRYWLSPVSEEFLRTRMI